MPFETYDEFCDYIESHEPDIDIGDLADVAYQQLKENIT